MTYLREILQSKGSTVHTIPASATMADVVEKLNEHNCGSLVVCEGIRMVGIITERDVLHAVADLDDPLADIPVEARMTTNVITGSPDDQVERIMGVMTQNRIRHLPVLDDDQLAGLVSMGDIVKSQCAELSVENHYLKTYIHS